MNGEFYGACMTSCNKHIQTQQSSSGDTCMRELEQRPQKGHTEAVKGDDRPLKCILSSFFSSPSELPFCSHTLSSFCLSFMSPSLLPNLVLC